jgi:hypothetical protein
MIAFNLILMTTVVVGIVSLLSWAIVSDSRSKRAAGGELLSAVAPLHRNLMMPRELRAHRGGCTHTARTRQTQSSMA